VSDVTANLSNADIRFLGKYADLSPDVRTYLNGLSQNIMNLNEQQYNDIQSGKINVTGTTLDNKLVLDEQKYVQGQLNSLKQHNSDLYNGVIQGMNFNANRTTSLADPLIPMFDSISDSAVSQAATDTRTVLGHDIRYQSIADRITYAQTLVGNLRASYNNNRGRVG
jgi:hypothetical protein